MKRLRVRCRCRWSVGWALNRFRRARPRSLAALHIDALPRPVRALLGGVGVSSRLASQGPRGAALASYLLFEAPYTQALIALGEADTLARRDEVLAFFDWRALQGACAYTFYRFFRQPSDRFIR